MEGERTWEWDEACEGGWEVEWECDVECDRDRDFGVEGERECLLGAGAGAGAVHPATDVVPIPTVGIVLGLMLETLALAGYVYDVDRFRACAEARGGAADGGG